MSFLIDNINIVTVVIYLKATISSNYTLFFIKYDLLIKIKYF